ncbi:hypothetical protein [Planococcus shixiaomingii]|uniref:hypothetical protein n=1 Tax=Planococcus shixiaomingii TaxID=3058393 RepID=UPI0026296301|nr:hypothetical protein [Planococcus sp. N022]WKA53805.1 hypothetical protein QWY21_14185 [Planococcus sp. N022]
MQKQRITVGYVELTEEESDQLFEEVKKDKQVENYSELQILMNDFDSRIVEPEFRPLAEVLAEEAPEEVGGSEERYIEIFNKLENDSRYRIKSSNQE